MLRYCKNIVVNELLLVINFYDNFLKMWFLPYKYETMTVVVLFDI